MSREIDPDKDWSEYTDDELQYALDRDWFPDEETAQKVNEYLRKKREEAPSVDDMTLPQLRQYAADNSIDLGDAKKKDEVLAAIKAAEG